VFRYLAIGETAQAERRERNLLAGRGNAQKLRLVGAAPGRESRDPIPFGDLLRPPAAAIC